MKALDPTGYSTCKQNQSKVYVFEYKGLILKDPRELTGDAIRIHQRQQSWEIYTLKSMIEDPVIITFKQFRSRLSRNKSQNYSLRIQINNNTSEDKNLKIWRNSSVGTLLKTPLSILFTTFLSLLLPSSFWSPSFSTAFVLSLLRRCRFGSGSFVFSSSSTY